MNRTGTDKSCIRVCLFAPAFPPVVGGIEVFLGTLAYQLAIRNVVVHIVAGTELEPSLIRILEKSGGSSTWVKRNPPPGSVVWEYDTFYRAEALYNALSINPVDIIHAASHDTALSAVIAREALGQIPIITAFGEIATESNNPFGQSRSSFIHSLDQIDAYLAWSKFYEELAYKYNLPRHKVHRILPGVEVDRFSKGSRNKGRKMLSLTDDVFILCCPSRFTPRKGQLELVKAVASLPIDRDKFRVIMTGSINSGSKEYMDEVLYEIKKANLEKIFIIKLETPFAELPHLMAAADIVVQPSHLEGLGGAALEAMATNTCTLLTNTRGFDEIAIHNVNSWIVEPKSPESLAEGILALMRDPALRKRLSQKASTYVHNNFRANHVADRILALYKKIAWN
ncbi:MAG: glycosyltransferase family 4 protein [bacterium]